MYMCLETERGICIHIPQTPFDYETDRRVTLCEIIRSKYVVKIIRDGDKYIIYMSVFEQYSRLM